MTEPKQPQPERVEESKRVLVLTSGGMDSAVVLAEAVNNFSEVHCLSINYGQTHQRELFAAKVLQEFYKIPETRRHHKLLNLREALPSASILNKTDTFNTTFSQAPANSLIADSWIPNRNIILLSIAAGLAYELQIFQISTGVNAIDWSGLEQAVPMPTIN